MHGELTATFQYLKKDYREAGEGLCVRNSSERTRENGYKLKEGKFDLDIRNKFFTVRMIRHWNRLPRQVVDTQPWS